MTLDEYLGIGQMIELGTHTFQPDAPSPPSRLALPASSSRCIGWASNSEANSMISSAVTTLDPSVIEPPTSKYSNAHLLAAIARILFNLELQDGPKRSSAQ